MQWAFEWNIPQFTRIVALEKKPISSGRLKMLCGDCDHDERNHDERTEKCTVDGCRCSSFAQSHCAPDDCPEYTHTSSGSVPAGVHAFATDKHMTIDEFIQFALRMVREEYSQPSDAHKVGHQMTPLTEIPDSVEDWFRSKAGQDWLSG